MRELYNGRAVKSHIEQGNTFPCGHQTLQAIEMVVSPTISSDAIQNSSDKIYLIFQRTGLIAYGS